MTEAILLKKGKKLRVFILSFDGEMEIQRFFDEGDSAPSSRGTIRGFRALLNHICEQGLDNFSSKQAEYFRALRLKRRFDAVLNWRE